MKKNMIAQSVGRGSLFIVSVNTRNARARPGGTWNDRRIFQTKQTLSG
jgi:hypothetical protein